MTQAQHTPEPWLKDQLATSSGCAIRTAKGEIVAVVKHGPKSDFVASYCEDNARLIAAAPELLDRLENLVIGIGMGWDLDGLIDASRAAIAKAKGEAA